jgi:hypothetical protein
MVLPEAAFSVFRAQNLMKPVVKLLLEDDEFWLATFVTDNVSIFWVDGQRVALHEIFSHADQARNHRVPKVIKLVEVDLLVRHDLEAVVVLIFAHVPLDFKLKVLFPLKFKDAIDFMVGCFEE